MRSLGLTLSALVVFGLSGTATADSIHMKTGTVIRTAKATIEGDVVVFEQYGSRVAIPLSLVERIVPDDHSGPVAITRDTPTRSSGTERSAASGTSSAATRATSSAASATSQPVQPEGTKDYWQDRVRALYRQGEQLAARLKEMRRVERAFLFSHRSTADTRRQIEDVEASIEANEQAKRDLRREARRKGVPPGWLRVRGVTY